MVDATVIIVPGLRDDAPGHWQQRLAARLRRVRSVPPLGRADLSSGKRVALLDEEANAVDGPVILVAHSAGVLTVAHWAQTARRPVQGALLAVPADLERPMPEGYPAVAALDQAGWLPLPRQKLPFASLVGASRNDPLCSFDRAVAFAADWGSRLVDLGLVGHLNPAAGYGDWPQAEALIAQLVAAKAA